ncbi:MAG TPA: hypothetical protein VML91_19270 [Burkholderiales bacterium]|nr:hypothetical protein [Burkholderiales bacterium]
MKLHSIAAHTTIGFALSLALGAGSRAAEIKVLASNGVKTVLEELAPQFEKNSLRSSRSRPGTSSRSGSHPLRT